MAAWIRRLGWKACILNGIAKQRRSPRGNGGKGSQEAVSIPKGIGDKHSGVEQTDKDTAGKGNGKKAQRRENRSSYDGEGKIDKHRVGSETKNKLILGSWKVY